MSEADQDGMVALAGTFLPFAFFIFQDAVILLFKAYNFLLVTFPLFFLKFSDPDGDRGLREA